MHMPMYVARTPCPAENPSAMSAIRASAPRRSMARTLPASFAYKRDMSTPYMQVARLRAIVRLPYRRVKCATLLARHHVVEFGIRRGVVRERERSALADLACGAHERAESSAAESGAHADAAYAERSQLIHAERGVL